MTNCLLQAMPLKAALRGMKARVSNFLMASVVAPFMLGMKSVRRDEGGNISIQAGLALAFAIVGGLVALLIVANLAPTVITAGANVTTAVKTTDFGDDTVNSLRGVFGLIIGLGVLAGIVGLALSAVFFRE